MTDEYIPRQAALKAIHTSTAPALEVKAMPAADVVKVIKCGQCKYWKQRDNREYGLCAKHEGIWLNSDFCSKGENKDGGQDNG